MSGFLRFDPETARDLTDALRLLEGRLRGTGRALAPGTRQILRAAEGSGGVTTDQSVEGRVHSAHDALMPGLLTIDETAEVLRSSTSSVKRLISSGDLPSVRLGRSRRIRNTDLADFIEELDSTNPATKEAPSCH